MKLDILTLSTILSVGLFFGIWIGIYITLSAIKFFELKKEKDDFVGI